ncbi:MAG TPA: adenylosuccinate lyase [bacterium]|nr:adenylosuccinate lyase [bacterium]
MIERYTYEPMGSIWSEENKFQTWLDVEIAVCEAWQKKGKIPAKSLATIKKKAAFEVDRINEIEKVTDHDVIAFLTNVAEHVGKDSRFIHMGMTSSDMLDTAQALRMRQAADILLGELKEIKKILKRQALKYKKTVMVGRTHGIHAEPMTFGMKMLLWYCEMERNTERIEKAKETVSVGKISGAVGTFSNLPPDIEMAACRKLKLKPAPIATQVIQRDRHAEFLSAIAITGGTIEKIATEIRGLQRTDVREAEEFFAKGQKGSSAMPHKRNPITCERIAGLSRILRANAHASMENIALWHERDITHSSVERVILPDSCILLHYMLIRLKRILDNLLVYPDAMIENLNKTRGLIFSSRVLLALVDKGITREESYSLVQRNAMKVWKDKVNFKDLLLRDPEVMSLLSEKDLDDCFDVNYFLRNVDEVYERVFPRKKRAVKK